MSPLNIITKFLLNFNDSMQLVLWKRRTVSESDVAQMNGFWVQSFVAAAVQHKQ